MMPFAVLTLLKATLVCGAAFSLARLCRRTCASARHMVFALAFAALVVIPLAATLLPVVQITIPGTAEVSPIPAPAMTPPVRSSGGTVPSESATPLVQERLVQARSVITVRLKPDTTDDVKGKGQSACRISSSVPLRLGVEIVNVCGRRT